MSKAILVLDKIPSSCYNCPAVVSHIGACGGKNNKLIKIEEVYRKPDWCPLKEVPEKYDLSEEFTYENMWDADEKWAFENGYNACLKEILGE